jgi:hypothetical protein
VVLQQVRDGLPIHGAEAMVTLGPDGKPLTTEHHLVDFPGPPKVSHEMAMSIAQKAVNCGTASAEIGERCITETPKAALGFQWIPGTTEMAYRVTLTGAGKSGEQMEQVIFVNVDSGEPKACAARDACPPAVTFLPKFAEAPAGVPGQPERAAPHGALPQPGMMAAPPSGPRPIIDPPPGPGPHPGPPTGPEHAN